jgi:predicted Zn-dependent protease
MGESLGRAAMPVIRKAQWSWQTVAGSEEDRLRAEQEMGSAMAVEIRQRLGFETPPPDTGLVTRLCSDLTRHVRDKRLAFRVEVVNLPELSAMALPGGFIFVGQSLIEFCQRYEDEVAFVIGHEMAHVIRGHAADRLFEESAFKVVSGLMRRAGPLATLVKQTGFRMLDSAYSQEQEFEADELGSRLAEAAGHHPLAGVRLFERLQALEGEPSALGQYFASHPTSAERIRNLGKLWPGRFSEG